MNSSRRIKVLLIETDRIENVGADLDLLLDSGFDGTTEVRHVQCDEEPEGAALRQLNDVHRAFAPAVSALILGRTTPWKQAKVLAEALATYERSGPSPWLVVFGETDAPQVDEMLDLGASDFLMEPLRAVEVAPRFRRLVCGVKGESPSAAKLKKDLSLEYIVGESAALLEALQTTGKIARTDVPVLVTGETGTGKEVFAQAIHRLSARSAKPFVTLNCGTLPRELAENELFGHEAGAFTGANSFAAGVARSAEGGTLFLDEVDSLDSVTQVKLLRLIQAKEIKPLGAGKVTKVDVRIMAAANVDLGAAVADGRFRPDLFYRLNVVNLHLPPLRERSGDIELLAQHFLRRFAVESGKPAFRWQPATLRKLLRHGWPGNVRELENVVLRAVALAAGPVIKPEDVGLPFPIIIPSAQSHAALKAKAILDFEKKYLDDLLRKHEGSISRAAVAAGQDPSNLRRLMRKCGLLPG